MSLFDDWNAPGSSTRRGGGSATAASSSSSSIGVSGGASASTVDLSRLNPFQVDEEEIETAANRDRKGQVQASGKGQNDLKFVTEDGSEADDGKEDDLDTRPRFDLEPTSWRQGLGSQAHSLVLGRMGGGNGVLVTADSVGKTSEQIWLWLGQHQAGNGKIEIEISSHDPKRNAVHKCFISPCGFHVLTSLENGDNYYVNTRQQVMNGAIRARGPIQRLKDVVVESVAWDRSTISDMETGKMLFGSSNGEIWEVSIEFARGKDRKAIQKLYQIGMKIPISGLDYVHLSSNPDSWFVMAATSRTTRFYEFIGGPTMEALFEQYRDPGNQSFKELPGDLVSSELFCFRMLGSSRPESFMLLSQFGLYVGKLNFDDMEKLLSHHDMVNFPIQEKNEFGGPPVSAMETEHHYIVLYQTWLVIINKLSKEVIHEEIIDKRIALGISFDNSDGAIYIVTNSQLFRLVVENEDGEIWKLMLERARNGDSSMFDESLRWCKTDTQREKVLGLQADSLFEEEELIQAAELYAQTNRSFEEVTLMLADQTDGNAALRAYLLPKLARLDSSQKTQRTITAVWLCQLFLESSLNSDEGSSEFHRFMREEQNTLRPAKDTIYKLISSHGRDDDYIQFALVNGDYERVVVRHIQRGRPELAVQTLAEQSLKWNGAQVDPPESLVQIYNRYSTELLENCPKSMVDTWIDSRFLDPCKFIPSLIRYSQKNDPNTEANEAIRYLEHCINVQGNEDEAIHNLLVSLYAEKDDDSDLRLFIQSPNRCFDMKYALRVCRESGKNQACVDLYSAMELFAEAVELALQVDLELAKINADLARDAATRRHLWLLIAENEIQDAVNKKEAGDENIDPIKRAIGILKDSNSALMIEDVLQFIPDIEAVEELKTEICASLEQFGKEIEELKSEMNEYTTTANSLREEIEMQNDSFMVISPGYSCDLCGEPVLQKGFYVFPCTHAFHSSCLLEEVARHAGPESTEQVDQLRSFIAIQEEAQASLMRKSSSLVLDQQEIAQDDDDVFDFDDAFGPTQPGKQMSKTDRERLAALDDFVASACPFCGDLMIQSISEPLISENEKEDTKEWSIC